MSIEFITNNTDKNTLVFHLKGRILGHSETESLFQSFEDEIEKGKTNFIYDLKKLECLNSAGLSLFIKVFKKIKIKGGKFALTNMTPRVEKILEITKLDTVFSTYDQLNEAVASFEIRT